MCISSTPKAPEVPEPPKPVPAAETLGQGAAATPQETLDDQLKAARLGLNQLRILPGLTLPKQ